MYLSPWVISMMRTWETQTEEVEMTEQESLESKIDRIHERMGEVSNLILNRYGALDSRLDGILKAGGSSRLTPVYALILLAVTFWAGCQVGGL